MSQVEFTNGAVHQNRDVPEHCDTAGQPVNLKERLISQEVNKDLVMEVGHITTVQPQAGSVQEMEASVLWIFDDCHKRYRERATNG